MNENIKHLSSVATQKEKIRQRYKGIDMDELDVIPAIPQESFYDDQHDKRVAVYARVSTDSSRQTSSYELQKNHYQDVIQRHPGWHLIEIYADEGISGTSLQHRDSFVRMINDCYAGKIDLIVTKSVSRFARNVLDCIGYVRKLAALQSPIGIFFETENLYTLNSNSEMSLSFISTLAQEESHNKSEIMNASIEMRFRRGIFLTPPLLGYDQDEDGNLVIHEEEAKTVRLIFFMYLYGYTCQEIADTLSSLGRRTKKGNTNWSPSSILNILQNERHCGDVLARKTWTPNYLDHKVKKNKQDRNQYCQRNHHQPIISRDDFIAVQRLISNAKYGNKGILPELHVITNGALKGFVSVNPRWAGFKAADYRLASESIYDDMIKIPSKTLEVNTGDFDLRGYEIARSQFFDTANKVFITFSSGSLSFSTECVRKFQSNFVELLIHPGIQLIAIRPVNRNEKNAIQWSRQLNGQIISRNTSGAAYLPNLYELFNWKLDCKYRIQGIKKHNNNDEAVLIFSLQDTEVLIPTDSLELSKDNEQIKVSFEEDVKPIGTKKRILAFPEEWVYTFGNDYYHSQSVQLSNFSDDDWNLKNQGTPFISDSPLKITSTKEIEKTIETMIYGMKQETNNERNN
ncbi:recombinase family protein [Anaerosporobacter sp.]|uniref:recombinase family protein n=1 Tax=Anaerosporobacter sp. TaxID=1872529 RepID=UPI00286F5D6C|nr:recombinase family protein [Anaerosporobacter sp.]